MVVLDRVRVGCRVVCLAEDAVGQTAQVVGDIDPLVGRVSGILTQKNRVRDIENAGGRHGVSRMTATRRVRNDRLDRRAVQAQRGVEPVVAGAAAAAILAHVNLSLGGTDVHEVAEVADA